MLQGVEVDTTHCASEVSVAGNLLAVARDKDDVLFAIFHFG
jgi:hypothetical protein